MYHTFMLVSLGVCHAALASYTDKGVLPATPQVQSAQLVKFSSDGASAYLLGASPF